MPTEAQLRAALIQADTAGDTESATMFADMIKSGQFDPVAPVDSDPSLLEDIGHAWDKRSDALIKTAEDVISGEIGFGTGLVQTGGAWAGLAGDVIGEGIMHTASTIGDGLEYMFPETYEGAAQGMSEAVSWVMNTEQGQAASKAFGEGYEAYQVWKKANPQDAKTFESVVNVAVLATPYKGKVNANPAPLFGRSKHFGAGLKAKSVAQKAKTRADKVQDLLFPEKLTDDMVMRTKQVGLAKRTVVQPNQAEAEMIKNVSKIKGVKYHRSDQHNLNVIRDHNVKLAQNLQKSLEKSTVTINHSAVAKRIDLDIDNLLKGNVSITQDKEMMNFLKGYIETAKTLVAQHPNTPAGLLAARKAFDAQLKREGKDLAFNAGRDSAQKTAVNTLRRTINDAIHDAVPDKAVRQSLAEQASLWRATDMLKPKAIAGAKDALGRTWQNLSRLLELKMGANRAFAVVGGISAVSASYAAMPFVAGGMAIGGTGMLLKYGINSPHTKMALGQILTLIDKGLKMTKNGDMIKQLRADRVLIQDLFEQPVEQEEKEK